jgi:CPA1 family monovalent cation:H+ antiporter
MLYLHKDIIKNVPIFAFLEIGELLAIISKLKTIVFMPDEVIATRGEYCREMYFINEGIVNEEFEGINGKEIAELKKGDHFGEMALITKSDRLSDAYAMSFCILESFSAQDFE